VDMANLLVKPAEAAGFTARAVISDGIPKSHKYLMYLKPHQGVGRERILVLSKGQAVMRNRVVSWAGVAPK